MSKKDSSFGFIIAAVIAVVVVVIIMVKITADPGGGEYNATVAEVVETDWVRGGESPKVTLIEYSDFECSACASYQRIFSQVFKDFGDDVRLVYRHFPLRGIHEHAFSAAQAAEAAGIQGKFWEMHDILYSNQTAWVNASEPKDLFVEYAERIGLDTDQFLKDFDLEEVAKGIEENEQQAQEQNFSGTPTIFLNGTQVKNIETYEDLKALVEEAGAEANETVTPTFQTKSATSTI
ncbi:MAG: thioredoxin domain-containing protein [Candidatus Magasanikbacteria bacterium]